jgi:hypothetical protein
MLTAAKRIITQRRRECGGGEGISLEELQEKNRRERNLFNPERDIPENAIMAVKEIMDLYANTNTPIRSSILFAQMQSGKTNAFLLLAGEMLRNEIVENVVIFTGNRETELKNQLTTHVKSNMCSFFDTKYFNYLEKNTDVFDGVSRYDSRDLALEIAENIKNKITIIWGTELTKKASQISTENTLFIFEESHFAQSRKQTPERFLNDIGVPVNGDNPALELRNNYICSVSATPFSELCDAANFNQEKKVIRMQPGNGYRGVKWLRDTGKLIGYDDWERTLSNALQRENEEGKWAIVRVRGDEQFEIAERICQLSGWRVYKYDQENSDIEDMRELENKPPQSSIVILREKCRMGTVVPKSHLSFVFETSSSSKTDTMLQGLLGRTCGYHNNDSLLVYLSQTLLDSGEINKYIRYWDGDDTSIPSNAKNVVGTNDKIKVVRRNHKQLAQIIPVHIPRRCITVRDCLKGTRRKEELIPDIIQALLEDEEVRQINYNPESVTHRIIELLETKTIKIETKKMSSNTCKTIPKKLETAIQHRKPPILASGAGCTLDGGCTLFYVDKDIIDYDFEVGSYYLCCYINLTDEEIADIDSRQIAEIPKTNGNEIFRYANTLETGETEFTNGGFTLNLKPETATDITIMLETLRECVLRSKETETMLTIPSKITSIRQPGFEKYTGIYLSLDVYAAILYGGEIYNTIKDEFNVVIKCKKNKGRTTKMPKDCIIRLAEISW